METNLIGSICKPIDIGNHALMNTVVNWFLNIFGQESLLIRKTSEISNQEFRYVLQEELAEGLHLIDFEQLKIENQTYNEKIEERNEVCWIQVMCIDSREITGSHVIVFHMKRVVLKEKELECS